MPPGQKRYVGAVPGHDGIRYRHKKDDPYTLRGYEVRYRDPTTLDKNGDPKVRGKTFRTLKEAKAFQDETSRAIRTRTFINPERGRTSWKEVSQQWLADVTPTLRNRSVEGYDWLLRHYLSRWDHLAISDIAREDVRRLIEDLRRPRKNKPNGLSQETEDKVFTVARQVFDYAVEERFIETSPASGKRRRRIQTDDGNTGVARALTAEKAESIISHLPEGRYRLFGLVAYWTAFRPGELAGLRVRNIDRLRNQIQVDETVEALRTGLQPGVPKTKRSRWRVVPVPKDVMTALWSYIEDRNLTPDDYLFAANGPYFVYKMFERRQWQKACKAAGYEHDSPRFYDLRHTRITMWVHQGVPPHVVMAWAGHSNIKTTMNVYTHVNPQDSSVEAIIKRLYGTTTNRPDQDDSDKRQDDEESA
ncbi:tyrosine-type recombinase/integrase [Pimelobacter simplex]|uniref:tyrosine-type recombinase/integrase n=1 Tax=Nocardioides simplex TaxID=2045 RepID=UPI003AAF08C5